MPIARLRSSPASDKNSASIGSRPPGEGGRGTRRSVPRERRTSAFEGITYTWSGTRGVPSWISSTGMEVNRASVCARKLGWSGERCWTTT